MNLAALTLDHTMESARARAASSGTVPQPPGDRNEQALDSIVGELARHCGFEGTLVEWVDPSRSASCVIANFGSIRKRGVSSGADVRFVVTEPSEKCGEGSVISFGDANLVEASFPVDSGCFVITNWLGTRGNRDAERSKRRFSEMLPLLSILFRTLFEGARLRARCHGFAAAIEHSDVATLILDEECSISFANKAAECILEERDGIRRVHERLAGAGIGDTLRLQSAVQHLAGADMGNAEPSPVIAIKRSGRRPLLIGFAQAEPATRLVPVDAMVIAYVFDPERSLKDIIEPVCSYYGLSLNETRLTCGLVEGHPLCEVAKSISIREQTARSYLKQIFAKTETNRQVELVQLFLRSSIRMMTLRKIRAFT